MCSNVIGVRASGSEMKTTFDLRKIISNLAEPFIRSTPTCSYCSKAKRDKVLGPSSHPRDILPSTDVVNGIKTL